MAVELLFKAEIDAPLDAVWRELTQPGVVQRAYFDSVLESDLEPGSAIAYRTPNGKHTFIKGEVVAFEPPRRFAHTFTFMNLPDAPTQVAYSLEPDGEGTCVTIQHTGFEGETKTWREVGRGWPFILGNLKSILERGKLPFKTRLQYALMKLFMPFMPKGD